MIINRAAIGIFLRCFFFKFIGSARNSRGPSRRAPVNSALLQMSSCLKCLKYTTETGCYRNDAATCFTFTTMAIKNVNDRNIFFIFIYKLTITFNEVFCRLISLQCITNEFTPCNLFLRAHFPR